MKIALGMITRNERAILEKTLLHKALWFEHRIAVDFYSSDYTVELLGSFGVHVTSHEWMGNFATARNILIQTAEEAGFDYLFMLDADEAMMQADIKKLKGIARQYDALTLPRVEFVQDFHHHDPSLYPDYQCRMFKLNRGFHFKNRVHEMLHDKNGQPVIHNPRIRRQVNHTPIYHYGRSKPKDILVLKYMNYDRLMQGLEPLPELPANYNLDDAKLWEKCEPFVGKHPLERL